MKHAYTRVREKDGQRGERGGRERVRRERERERVGERGGG